MVIISLAQRINFYDVLLVSLMPFYVLRRDPRIVENGAPKRNWTDI